MSDEVRAAPRKGRPWLPPWAVFFFVLVAQLMLVAAAGTDIPFQDQWDAEGRKLYPDWVDGNWRPADLLAPHNEHRIAWTRALDLALFIANNNQWDPLVQLTVDAFLRAAVAALLTGFLTAGFGVARRWWSALGIALLFLPHLAWHNALWGFQSHVYFVLLFSVVALASLGAERASASRRAIGLLAGGAALLAMGAALLLPFALLAVVALRMIEERRWSGARIVGAWPAWALLAAAFVLRRDVPDHAVLRPASLTQFVEVAARAAAWPHTWLPLAAVALNLPLVWLVGARIAGRRRAAVGEDFVVALGAWAAALVLAMAWTRGGSDEFSAGVPSRYVDFIVLLPIVNAWCAVRLARVAGTRWRPVVRLAAVGWGVFLLVGWVGLSAEAMSRLILPRMRDRDAPVRVAVTFQRTRDPAVFRGQPLLYVPHPNPASITAVLDDPRLRGKLPPSLQPGRPQGPLSRAVRSLLGRQ